MSNMTFANLAGNDESLVLTSPIRVGNKQKINEMSKNMIIEQK